MFVSVSVSVSVCVWGGGGGILHSCHLYKADPAHVEST